MPFHAHSLSRLRGDHLISLFSNYVLPDRIAASSRIEPESPAIRKLLSKQQLGSRRCRLTVLVPECRLGDWNLQTSDRLRIGAAIGVCKD